MRSRPIRTLALAAAVALSVVACGDDANDESDTSEPASTEATATPTEAPEATIAGTTMAPEPTMAPDTTDAAATGTIVDVATDAGFTTLVAAVEAAGLVATLSGPGPFTVFAPTDGRSPLRSSRWASRPRSCTPTPRSSRAFSPIT